MTLQFLLNAEQVRIAGHPGVPLLDYLRHEAGLTGVKHACREGDCGSCVVLLGRRRESGFRYDLVTSCLLPLAAVEGRHVVTVEGLDTIRASPIQNAFIRHAASQCGFCTPGFVVSLTGHLLEAHDWRADDFVEAIAGNICRCTGYTSIRRAVDDLVMLLRDRIDPSEPRVPALVREGHLPEYFLTVADVLGEITADRGPEFPKPDELVVSGGTDLYVQRPFSLEAAPLFFAGEPRTRPVWEDDDHVYLDAAATAEDMKQSTLLAERVGGIDRAMHLMGSWPIRNRATVAGNLVNASPIGDMTIVLLALDSELSLRQPGGRRILPLRDFFRGYKSLDLEPGELVEWVRFPRDRQAARFNFEKVSKRTHLDIASVNTAMSVATDGGSITRVALAAGGVAPIPMRLEATEALLVGRTPDVATARAAAATAGEEVSPISDVRGSAAYKRLLLQHLVLAQFHVLFGLEEGLLEVPA